MQLQRRSPTNPALSQTSLCLSHLPLCQEADGDDLRAPFFSRDDASQGNRQGEHPCFVKRLAKSAFSPRNDACSSCRIVPITGAFRPGWPTTLTILCTHLHVSEAHEHTHINMLLHVLQHCRPSVSTAYGNVQAHCALVTFAVCCLDGRKIIHSLLLTSSP